MNPKTGKILKIAIFALLLLLLTAAAAVGLWIWYWPMRWNQDLQNSYLLRNQPTFRTGSVQPGNFRHLLLKDLELGPSGHELLKASSGTITLSLPGSGNWQTPGFKLLHLQDCKLHLQSRNHQLWLNNCKLPDFLTQIAQLPAGPDGEAVPLKINGTLQNNRQTTSQIELTITPDRARNVLLIAGLWQSQGQKTAQGRWNCHIDLTTGIISASFSGDLPLEFYQELLLRSNVPPQLTALLQQGKLHGQGSFSGSFKDMKINELNFSGTLDSAQFKWYNQSNIKAETMQIELHKTPRIFTLKIPSLQFSAPAQLQIQDVILSYRSGKSKVTIAAKSDLRLAGINFFSSKFNYGKLPFKTAAPDSISGNWDLAAGHWQLQGKSADSSKYSNLQLDSGNKNKLLLTPEKLVFNASGNARGGIFKQELDFADLELFCASGIFRSPRGKFHASAELDFIHNSANHTLEFNFAELSGDTPKGQFDLRNTGGKLNLRQHRNKTQELYIIARGNSGNLLTGQGRMEFQQWSGTANLENTRNTSQWRIAGIDLSIPQLKISAPQLQGALEIKKLNISASGSLNHLIPTHGLLKISAATATHANWEIQQPQLKFELDTQRPADRMLNTSFNCRKIVLPPNPTGIHSADNARLQFASTLTDFPTAIKLQAAKLQMHRAKWQAELLNTNWQLQKESASGKWDCNIKFHRLALQSQQESSGTGNFGNGTISMQADLNAQQELLKLRGIAELQNASWRYFQLHTGAENMQADWEFDDLADTCLQGNLKLQNSNIIGEYFSVSTPLMESVFSAADPQNITGALQFASGSISSADNQLELQNVELKLPFTAAGKKPAKLPSGTLKAASCNWKNQSEGPLQCTLEHFWQTTNDLNRTAGHTLKLDGTLLAEKFDRAPVNWHMIWHLPPEKPVLSCAFKMEEKSLVQPLVLNKYLNVPFESAILKGSIAFSGQLEYPVSNSGKQQLNLKAVNSDWQVGEIAAEDVTADWHLSSSGNQLSAMPQDVTISRILWKNWQLNDNILKLALTPEQEIFISSWQGKFKQGFFRLTRPATVSARPGSAEKTPLFFDVRQIPAGKFFAALRLQAISSTALLSGNLQTRIINDQLYFTDSHLAFKSPGGEKLQIRPQDPEAIRIRDPQYSAFALAVLGNMKCYQAQFDFATAPGELTMLLKAEGVPAEPVPFVYQGRKSGSPFRPAAPGEPGFDDEIELNVNLKLHPEDPGI